MREWQVGDPIGEGNDIGVPDIKYMDYLKNNGENYGERKNNPNSIDTKKSRKFQDEAVKLWEENKLTDALSYINSAIHYNPNDDENWNVKGLILWDMAERDIDKFYEACKCFNNALIIKPDGKILKKNKARCITDLARYYYAINDYSLAMSRINESLSLIEDKTADYYATALNLKSCIYFSELDYGKALEYINKALKISPNDEIIQQNRENILNTGYVNDEDSFCDAAEYNLKLGNTGKASKYYYDLGFKFEYSEDEKEKSVKYYKKAIDINPSYNKALIHLGYTLKDLGRYREAITYFERANTWDDGEVWHIANCYMELKEYSSAIPYLDKCIERAPLRDDWTEQKFECLLAINKTEAIGFYHSYAKFLRSEGYYFESLKYLDKILELKSDDTYAISQKQKYLKNKRIISLYNILNAVYQTKCSTLSGSDEDLKAFMEDISKRSGESIENILNFYKYPKDDDYDFKRLFDIYISDYKWKKIFNIYDIGSIGDPCIIEIDEEDNNESLNNITDALSNRKTLDEMEDEYWSLVNEKNSYDILDEVNIIRNDEEENKNNRLSSTDNEVTIIQLEEEPNEETKESEEIVEQKYEKLDKEELIKETKDSEEIVQEELSDGEEKENTNINYLSKIKEAKELLDGGDITQQEYDELKWKYLDLI